MEKRQVGDRDICEVCSKVVRDDVQSKWMPKWDGSKINVHRIMCKECGNEPVTITIAQKFRNRGKLYDVRGIGTR